MIVIPMGTVVTVCMLITVVFASRFPYFGLNYSSPDWLLRTIGTVTCGAGFWNVLWYSIRNFKEFWGMMALGSGVLMILLSALLILPRDHPPEWLNKLRPGAVMALLGFAVYYANTIYHL